MEILETKIYLGLGGSPNPCLTPCLFIIFLFMNMMHCQKFLCQFFNFFLNLYGSLSPYLELISQPRPTSIAEVRDSSPYSGRDPIGMEVPHSIAVPKYIIVLLMTAVVAKDFSNGTNKATKFRCWGSTRSFLNVWDQTAINTKTGRPLQFSQGFMQ